MAGTPPYQTVYNVGLLDDLHNYFPALLYEQSRFSNLSQVFHYVRNQMNTRFNLYSYGASLSAAAQPPPQVFHAPRRQPAVPPQPSPIIITPREEPTSASALANLTTTNLLLGLLSAGLTAETPRAPAAQGQHADAWATFRNPVVVRPTPEQIEAASEVVDGSTLTSNTVCAVCQDNVRGTDTARRLRHCAHVYHRGCIDQWFQQSVVCPACRHDIRE